MRCRSRVILFQKHKAKEPNPKARPCFQTTISPWCQKEIKSKKKKKKKNCVGRYKTVKSFEPFPRLIMYTTVFGLRYYETSHDFLSGRPVLIFIDQSAHSPPAVGKKNGLGQI